jgi:hypothetical protein
LLLEDRELIAFQSDVNSVISGFEQKYDSKNCSHMMFILDDWAKAKYENTKKDYWRTVPSVHFEDYSYSDFCDEESLEADISAMASDWSEEEEVENDSMAQAMAELLPKR